jgi:Cu+-exporting ATPase
MSLSSVCVVTNALRLRFFISKNQPTLQEKTMKKILTIDGMMCSHCKMNVEKVLMGLPPVVFVSVNLEAKTATVELNGNVPDAEFIRVISEAGYKLLSID